MKTQQLLLSRCPFSMLMLSFEATKTNALRGREINIPGDENF
jgi:hypothetical protein